MKQLNILLCAVFAASLSTVSLTVDARAGGGGSSGGHSSSSSSHASTSHTATAAPRAGNAANTGMQRSSVMQEARGQSPQVAPVRPAPATPTPGNVQGAAVVPAGAAAPAVPGRPGYTGGQVLGAAAAGAAAGYLLHSATSPGIVNSNGLGQGAMGNGATGSFGSGGAGGGYSTIGLLLLLLLLGGLAYVAWCHFRGGAKRASTAVQPMAGSSYLGAASGGSALSAIAIGSGLGGSDASLREELLAGALTTFRQVQDANNREDAGALGQLVDESYLPVLTQDMGSRETPSATKVHALRVVGGQVLGFERQDERYVGSIHFSADVSESNAPSEEVEEVWHFVRPLQGGRWKLAGIEQV